MDAIIHIGMPKAGSSTIQQFLQVNRAALLRQGFLYDRFNPRMGSQFELPLVGLTATNAVIPPKFERNLLALHDLGAQQAHVQRYTHYLDARLAQDCGSTRFIGSSEHIFPWLNTPGRIEALDRFLCARFNHVRYLVYLRNPEEFVLSGYSEAIRRGQTHSLAAHLRKASKVNHAVQIDRWVKVVGRDRFTLRPLSPGVLHAADLLTDFACLVGVDMDGLQRPDPVNVGLSVQELTLRRYLNRVLPVQDRHGALPGLYQAALTAGLAVWRSRTRPRLNAAQRAQIRALNAHDMEILRRRFFPGRQDLF